MKKKLFLMAIILAVFLVVGPAHATSIGNVDLQHYYELTSQTYGNTATNYDLDSSSWTWYMNESNVVRGYTASYNGATNQLTLTFNYDGAFSNSGFNGLQISGIDTVITDVQYNGSNLGTSRDFGANFIDIDLASNTFATGDFLTLDITFEGQTPKSTVEDQSNPSPNPIPAPFLLLGTGLVGLAGFRRKVRK